MSIQVSLSEKVIAGLVKNYTTSAGGKELLFLFDEVDEGKARDSLQNEGVQPSDIDRFICEARFMGEAYTIGPEILEGKVDEVGLFERVQKINSHLKALEQDVFVGPKEEQNTDKQYRVEVTVEGPTESKDILELTYGLKLMMWIDRLVRLANKKVEEAKLP